MMSSVGDSDYLGPYRLCGELGRGAMARVWRAWDYALGREVAIKEPLLDQSLSGAARDEAARRFVNEAKTVAGLSHPGIVTVYAADVYDGRPAIVMELVEGMTLSQMLEAGPLEPAAALDALNQLLDAVGYAHARGVIHRDIKPDNIFVDVNGRIRLTDFGIAHVDGSAGGTMAGAILGTPGYMSPEQARGLAVDARSDLFSIGVVAFEMLSGTHPFGADYCGDVTTLLYRIVHEEPGASSGKSLADLPPGFAPAIGAALSKDPSQRPQSAEAMKSMLHGETVYMPSGLQTAVSSASRPTSSSATHTTWAPYAIVAFIGIVVLLAIFMSASGSSGGGGGGSVTSTNASSSSSSQAESTMVPDLVGLTAEEAEESAEDAGFVISVKYVKDDEALVMTQSPEAYEDAEEGSTISVTVGTGDSILASSSENGARTASITVKKATDPNKGQPVTSSIRLDEDDQVIADLDSHTYTESEINALGLSDAELFVAYNSIFASTGYAFETDILLDFYTSNCKWYFPDSSISSTKCMKMLNKTQKSNYKLIFNIQQERGSWYTEVTAENQN